MGEILLPRPPLFLYYLQSISFSMSSDLILAIDAGTTGCRAVAFSGDGERVASAYREFPGSYPRPNWVEQDATEWWKAICESTRGVMKELGNNTDIAAVAVTNQRETVVPVAEDGKPLRGALVWQDRRSTKECEFIESELGADRIYDVTGLVIDPYFTLPKLVWLQLNEPEVFSAASKFLLVHDYVVFKLTGRCVTEHSNASRTMLFDLKSREWSPEILARFEISEEKLPELLPPGTLVGEIAKEASEQTGLPEGTGIYTGGGDQQCAALGCGVVKSGRVSATTGTGTFCLAFSAVPLWDAPQRRLLCSAHALPGTYVVEASIFTTGAAYRWLRNNFAQDLLGAAETDPYDVLNEEAKTSAAGARGVTFIPHLAGAGAPHWNPSAVGVLHGLSVGHTRGDIVRAMMEGTSVEIKKNLEVMKAMKIPITELCITGGGARSKLWAQIQADMCGIPVLRSPTEDATALGAAILAAVGAKIHKNIETAVESMVKPGTKLEPDKDKFEIYQQVYERSIKLYNQITSKGEESP
ncbi:MAG: xylulokinase [Thermoplasmata archaeon]|nr:MAG: xylulokinase [Thermoplasmata archaeon]